MNLYVMAVMWVLGGCVTIRTHEMAKMDERIRALDEAAAVAEKNGCEDTAWIIKGKIAATALRQIGMGFDRQFKQ